MSHQEVRSANLAVKRRTRVVGIFPNDAAITRLVGAVLMEQDEHWQLEDRRMFSAESMAAIAELEDLPTLLSTPARELQNPGPKR
jgi:transposase-like protein